MACLGGAAQNGISCGRHRRAVVVAVGEALIGTQCPLKSVSRGWKQVGFRLSWIGLGSASA